MDQKLQKYISQYTGLYPKIVSMQHTLKLSVGRFKTDKRKYFFNSM